jgi:hypothetical protein
MSRRPRSSRRRVKSKSRSLRRRKSRVHRLLKGGNNFNKAMLALTALDLGFAEYNRRDRKKQEEKMFQQIKSLDDEQRRLDLQNRINSNAIARFNERSSDANK